VREAEVDEHEFSVTAFPRDGASVLTTVTSLATERRWPVEQLRLEAGRLDEVFRAITTGPAGGPL
jgi:ABC-2 type transport system ATP-binding protein